MAHDTDGGWGGWTLDIPLWLRAYFFIGFPSLAAIVLAGIVFGWIKVSTPALNLHDTATREANAAAITAMILHESNQVTRGSLQTAWQVELLGITRQICRNVSRDNVERAACGR